MAQCRAKTAPSAWEDTLRPLLRPLRPLRPPISISGRKHHCFLASRGLDVRMIRGSTRRGAMSIGGVRGVHVGGSLGLPRDAELG